MNPDRKEGVEAVVNPLTQACQEYRKAWDRGSLEPELVDHTFQTWWRVLGERINQTYEVPLCDRTKSELDRLRENEKGVLLLPHRIMTKIGLYELGLMFPLTGYREREDTADIWNTYKGGGCVAVEMGSVPPLRDTTGLQVEEIFSRNEITGQRLATYFVGTHFSLEVTGHRFDEESTSSRLLGSRNGSRPVRAHSNPDGKINIYWPFWNLFDNEPNMGARSEQVKKHKS